MGNETDIKDFGKIDKNTFRNQLNRLLNECFIFEIIC